MCSTGTCTTYIHFTTKTRTPLSIQLLSWISGRPIKKLLIIASLFFSLLRPRIFRMSDRQNSCIRMHRPMHTRTIPGSIAAGPSDLSSMHMHTAVRSEFTAQYGNPRSCNIYPIIASSSTFALTPAAPLSTMSMYRYPVHYSQIL